MSKIDQGGTPTGPRDLRDPQERQARTVEALRDFFHGAARSRAAGPDLQSRPGFSKVTRQEHGTNNESL